MRAGREGVNRGGGNTGKACQVRRLKMRRDEAIEVEMRLADWLRCLNAARKCNSPSPPSIPL